MRARSGSNKTATLDFVNIWTPSSLFTFSHYRETSAIIPITQHEFVQLPLSYARRAYIGSADGLESPSYPII